jgi:TrmH family RNA methyltransferase
MITKSQVKYIQSLSHKKFRDQEDCFIVEGPKMVEEMLQEGLLSVRELFATEEWIEKAAPTVLQNKGVNLTSVRPQELQRISFLQTANQVLGIFNKPASTAFVPRGITLMLDDLQDPGNMGTIIRCADWFGISHIIAGHESADVYAPKVVQASMGSVARVRVWYASLSEIIAAFPAVPVYAASLQGEPLNKIQKPSTAFLLIGNEGRGIQKDLLSKASFRVRIAGKGKAESLNAAVATGILLSWLT